MSSFPGIYFLLKQDKIDGHTLAYRALFIQASINIYFGRMADSMRAEDEHRGTGNKKLTKSKSGLRIIPINNTARSPFELKEPTWSPDKEVSGSHSANCNLNQQVVKIIFFSHLSHSAEFTVLHV